MKIELLVHGDPDIKPISKIFHYDKSDELLFFESTKVIKKRLGNNLRLNLDETLWLYVAYVITSINEGKSTHFITKNIPELLFPNQVMIGVPESMRKLTFLISTKNNDCDLISISTPIPINQYFFHEQEKTM